MLQSVSGDEMTTFGSKLYALYDSQLKGFITWIEKNESAILLFTSGAKAEAYLNRIRAGRPVDVSIIYKQRAKDFVDMLLVRDINYALVDVPPEQTDVMNDHPDEVVRNYALVDLRTLKARMK